MNVLPEGSPQDRLRTAYSEVTPFMELRIRRATQAAYDSGAYDAVGSFSEAEARAAVAATEAKRLRVAIHALVRKAKSNG